MPLFTIETAIAKQDRKILTIRGERGGSSVLTVGKYALVGPGDQLRIQASGAATRIDLVAKDGPDVIPVHPPYHYAEKVSIGSEEYDLEFSEVETQEQAANHRRLEAFHYRGRSKNENPDGTTKLATTTGGRKGVLLATLKVGNKSRVVGYLELQMPLMMCKPRHNLLTLPFTHSSANVSWTTWLGDGQKHVNRIVRIARVVVDPEFRGIGLSSRLVESAKKFAFERWSIAGCKPLFIEISAEMLRYVDFVSNCGLRHIGDTEGNLGRIFKDLHSIEQGASGKSQIMSLQKKYHAIFSEYCARTGHSFDEARTILSELLSANDPRSAMPSDEWLAFRPILRFPIPYHFAGLDEQTEKYVRLCLDDLEKRNPVPANIARPPQLNKQIPSKPSAYLSVKGLEIWTDQELTLTPFVRLAMDSFGIDSSRLRSKLVGPIDLELMAGNILLVTGASGSGKSVLLNAIQGLKSQGLIMKGGVERNGAKVVELKPLPEKIPILQYFGERYGAQSAFDTLCRVGLSEAMVFVKPFSLLSMGQRYRAMLAAMLLKKADIWIADEFCSNLDPITATILSVQIRKLAKRSGVIFVAAAANTGHFIGGLRPDSVLLVRSGGEVLQLRSKEYQNGFFEKGL